MKDDTLTGQCKRTIFKGLPAGEGKSQDLLTNLVFNDQSAGPLPGLPK